MDSNSSPFISIIVAVFNGAKTLQQCIDSVACQTHMNKELIIIDGGSTDGTVEILKKNAAFIKYWISEPDNGIYDAWNKGLAKTQGEWICFLGADDFLLNPQVLVQLSTHLTNLSVDVRVVCGKVMLLNHNGESLYAIGEPWEKVRKSFLQLMTIPHQGAIHRHTLFEQHGLFDETFQIAGDYELLLRELKTGEAMFISDLVITGMRQGGVSSTPTNSLLLLWEIRRAQRMHGQRFPGAVWLMAIAKVYIRLFLWNLLGEKLSRKTLDLGRKVMGLPPHWTRT